MKISLKDDINSISYFKSNFNKILKNIKENQRPIVLTQNGKSAGVFMDITTWENFIRKINLLKLVNEGESSVKNEELISLEDIEKEINGKYDI